MIAIARVSQETDTFNPVLTELKSLDRENVLFGEDLLGESQKSGAIGGFLKGLEEAGDERELAPIFGMETIAGGRITANLLDFLNNKLISGLRKVENIEAVLLSMHGAMAAENEDDVEGFILESIRNEIGDNIPIVAGMDHHGNITDKMTRNADLMVAHETQPHDLFATGRKVAVKLAGLLRGDFKPVASHVKIPMIAPQDNFLTSSGPMKELFDFALAFEDNPKVVAVSVLPMQPWLDVLEGGWSVLVYTDGNKELGDEIAEAIAEKAWGLREEFWKNERVATPEAIAQAERTEKGLIILSDTGDAVYGGGTGDTTCILEEMLKQQISSTALLPIVDPEAVAILEEAGIGAELTVELGGKRDSKFCSPIKVTGKVGAISPNRWVETEGWHSFEIDKSILFECGSVKIAVMSNGGYAINHPELYKSLGLDPANAKMVVLKTGSNFQFFSEWTSGLIRVDTPGCTQSNLEYFDWENLPRPIYPFDDIQNWR